MNKKIILSLVVVILVINIFMPLSVAQKEKFEELNIETSNNRKEVKIGSMYVVGDPGNFIWEFNAYDIGTITVKKGEVVVFYCPYTFNVGGAADDILGSIDCTIGGAGYDEAKTGTQKTGRLECSKAYATNTAIRFKLYLKYTDYWGTWLIKEETKYSNGNLIAPIIFECKINIKREVLDIYNLEIKEVNKVSSVVNKIDEFFFLFNRLYE